MTLASVAFQLSCLKSCTGLQTGGQTRSVLRSTWSSLLGCSSFQLCPLLAITAAAASL